MAIENEMLYTWVKLLNVSKGLNSLLMEKLAVFVVCCWLSLVFFPSIQEGKLGVCTFSFSKCVGPQ